MMTIHKGKGLSKMSKLPKIVDEAWINRDDAQVLADLLENK